MEQKKSDIFSISLHDFISSHLRDDFSFPVSLKLAEVIDKLSRGKCICHVQFTSFEGKKLNHPLLWKYKYWVESSEKYQKDKERSEHERQERYIFDYNVKIVSKACINIMLMEESQALSTAFVIVKHNKTNALTMLGVELKT